MSAPTFTAGKWQYRETRDGDAWVVEAYSPTQKAWGPVAHVFGPPPSDDGNAALISASPLLHAALVRLLAAAPAFRAMPIGAPGSIERAKQDEHAAAEDEARAALAKARGE